MGYSPWGCKRVGHSSFVVVDQTTVTTMNRDENLQVSQVFHWHVLVLGMHVAF